MSDSLPAVFSMIALTALSPPAAAQEAPPIPPVEATVVKLPPMDAGESAPGQGSAPGALFGAGRSIPPPRVAPPLNWHQFAGGRSVATLQVISPGAAGLRLALKIDDLPDDASLRFYGTGPAQPSTILGTTINASIEANRRGSPEDQAADIYWSPLIRGEAVTLKVELLAAADATDLKIELPRVSHFFRWPGTARKDVPDCWEDVACHPGWEAQSRATAMMLYTKKDGTSGACTGTLLSDSDPSSDIPYFVTAHHCAPDQVRASSIETFWFYRSQSCGAAPSEVQVVRGGADLLYAEKSTDTAFLRLRHPAPTGAAFADWSASLPAEGTAITGVLHPLGGPQAVAFGEVTQYLNCSEIDSCAEGANPEEAHFFEVTWTKGVSEVGGSGSGVFLPTGQLVGVLSGGVGSCGGDDNFDDIGRFDIPYRDALHKWLGPEPKER